MNISEIIESSFDLNEDDITENVPLKKPTFNSQHCYSETSNSEDHFGFKQIK